MKLLRLRASDSFESGIWDQAIAALPVELRDIHFTAAYGRVQEKLGGKAMLLLGSNSDGRVMQPFIKRDVPIDRDDFSRYCDLVSPYGYGGPVSDIESPAELCAAGVDFQTQLSEWAAQEQIITEFCYLHPLMLLHQTGLVEAKAVKYQKQIVVVNLADLGDEFVELSRRIKRGIKTSKADGISVHEAEPTTDNRRMFAELYNRSMTDKNAHDRWRFSPEYLDAHYDELAARLFFAVRDSQLHRALMVIGGYGTAYAHFLGSDGKFRDSGMDERLYFEAAIQLKADGYERFHLGGGLTSAADDRLLAFKKGFVEKTLPMYSCARVFDEAAYMDLCVRKTAMEAVSGKEFKSGFFPQYRRES